MKFSPAARAALGVGVVSFVVYLLTQTPGLYYTDAGELAAACSTWGVAHPTGYPLFTLLGHLWTLLPWPSTIKGLNILVALFTACSAALMVFLNKRIVQSVLKDISERTALWTSTAGAALFAFGTTVWAQSTAVEVYSLNLLLFVATVYAATESVLSKDRSIHYTVLTGLLFGFMVSNHLSSVFLFPGIALMWWMGTDASTNKLRAARWLVAPMIIGPTLYALLPLRSSANPPINWGMVHRGWTEFLYHVKGTQFGVWMFSDSKTFKTNASIFTSLVSTDTLYIGWILIVVGIVFAFRNQRALAAGLLLLAAGNLGISLGYAIPDIESYFLPTITVFTVLATVGLARLATKLKGNASLAVFALPVIAFGLHFTPMDMSKHRAVDGYVRWALDNAEPNAVIITRQWDFLASGFWYLQTVEGVRKDVSLIDKELLRRTWYAPYLNQLYPSMMGCVQREIDEFSPWLRSFEQDNDAFMANRENSRQIQVRFVALLNALIAANSDRPVYITPEILNEEEGFAQGVTFAPAGPLFKVIRDTTARVQTKANHLADVTQSLVGRTTRLDSALAQTVESALYSNAMYALEQRADTAAFRVLRQHSLALNSQSRVSRFLLQRLP